MRALACPSHARSAWALAMPNYVRLTALLGPARVKELIFTARLIDLAEARAIGLLSEVLPDYAALQNRAEELARTVAAQTRRSHCESRRKRFAKSRSA